MAQARTPKRDKDVDTVRTIYWFRYLEDWLGTHQPREVQRIIAPDTLGLNANGERKQNNRFLGYSKGEHVPHDPFVAIAERVAPRSSWALNHPLWMALRQKGSVAGLADGWIRQLDPEIQRIVLSPGREIGLGPNRHRIGALERRASMDSLAALTIIFRISHEQGEAEWAWLHALSIFRVLLLMWPHLEHRTLADRVFQIFVQRVFHVVSSKNQRMDLEHYDYSTMSQLLNVLAEKVREQHEPQRERNLPTFYALQILNGNRAQRFHQYFQVPVVTDDNVK